VIKQAKLCTKKLLELGAHFDIKDASGKTAYDYAKEINNNEILNLFPRQQSKVPSF
jgi:ankyrin repeat protein